MTSFELMLLLHIIGDFYLQTDKLNQKKKRKIIYLIVHVATYSLLFIPLFFICDSFFLSLIAFFIISGTHFLLDLLKCKFGFWIKSAFVEFSLDQLLHIVFLFASWLILKNHLLEISQLPPPFQSFGIVWNYPSIIGLSLTLLLILKPASIFIELLLPNKNKTAPKTDSAPSPSDAGTNFGSFIGMLERLVILLLALSNLWSSIALVFTAKSIARFKQLEDKEFAQKYLIGTLLSLAMTLIFMLLFLHPVQ